MRSFIFFDSVVHNHMVINASIAMPTTNAMLMIIPVFVYMPIPRIMSPV
ncbi:hypothetical protein SDC9_132566 [bioreactor metagenome]|uniref:Uncharacterized protein n=1 Tax=bioreactor metagenome TaxID=1076179 RepID=A0A645D8E9_9ZZZZ